MEELMHISSAYLRFIPLFLVIRSSVKHRDFVGLLAGTLWALTILLSSIMGIPYASSILLTPLVCVVAWHIIKTHRDCR